MGVVRILDDDLYTLDGDEVVLRETGGLTIEAANGHCPSIRGDVDVVGQDTTLTTTSSPSLTLNGLHLDGQIMLVDDLTLRVIHCTLVPRPGRPSITWEAERTVIGDAPGLELRVVVTRSIVGSLRLPAEAEELSIADSVVDAGLAAGRVAIASADAPSSPGSPPSPPYGPTTMLTGATILGSVCVREFRDAHDAIFMGQVAVQRQQVGSIAYSYVPPDSLTPVRFRCQPDLALAGVTDPTGRAIVQAQIRPRFNSTVYGQAAYAQLAGSCPAEITMGSQDGSEMGAFCFLNSVKMQAALQSALREYLDAGLVAGVFYAT